MTPTANKQIDNKTLNKNFSSKMGIKVYPTLDRWEVVPIQWHMAIPKHTGGGGEVEFVANQLHTNHIMSMIFDEIGLSLPIELRTIIDNGAIKGETVEVNIADNARIAGRADLLIEYVDSEGTARALWMEMMDKSGVWDQTHHDQWKSKLFPLMREYESGLTAIMVASTFSDAYVTDFNNANDMSAQTYAVSMTFPAEGKVNFECLTDNKQSSADISTVNGERILPQTKDYCNRQNNPWEVLTVSTCQNYVGVRSKDLSGRLFTLNNRENDRVCLEFSRVDKSHTYYDLQNHPEFGTKMTQYLWNAGFGTSPNKRSSKNIGIFIDQPNVAKDPIQMQKLIDAVYNGQLALQEELINSCENA